MRNPPGRDRPPATPLGYARPRPSSGVTKAGPSPRPDNQAPPATRGRHRRQPRRGRRRERRRRRRPAERRTAPTAPADANCTPRLGRDGGAGRRPARRDRTRRPNRASPDDGALGPSDVGRGGTAVVRRAGGRAGPAPAGRQIGAKVPELPTATARAGRRRSRARAPQAPPRRRTASARPRRGSGRRRASPAEAAARGQRGGGRAAQGAGRPARAKPVEAVIAHQASSSTTRRSSAAGTGAQGPPGRSLPDVRPRATAKATQIAVLEGRSLIEHYVSRPSDDVSQIHGNIYLGRVQNVLPGMEAAFVDIGTPKNAVLYRGDVHYDPEDIERRARAARAGAPHRARAQGPADHPLPGHEEPDRRQGRPPHPGGVPARPVRGADPQQRRPTASPSACPTTSASGCARSSTG